MALVHATGMASPLVFLFDELFRDTGTAARIPAAEATLAELVDSDRRAQHSPAAAQLRGGGHVDVRAARAGRPPVGRRHNAGDPARASDKSARVDDDFLDASDAWSTVDNGAMHAPGNIRVSSSCTGKGMVSTHLRSHLLLYETPIGPTYDRTVGVRLLWLAALMVLSDAQVQWLGIPAGLTIPYLLVRLALALALIRFFVGINYSGFGFRSITRWTTIEKSFLVQIVVVGNLVFPLAFSVALDRLLLDVYVSAFSIGFLAYFIHGFTQELVYRGLLQTELTRRWGVVAGVLVANTLYTFGPLHADYYALRASVMIPMFGAVFAMGLLFALHFHRSRNLWLVAVMHGIGQAHIVLTVTGAGSVQ